MSDTSSPPSDSSFSQVNPAEVGKTFNKEAADWLKGNWKGTDFEAKKIYTFNQTGNILYSTTVKTTPESVPIQELSFPPDVKLEFDQVAVFMASLTKALANSWTGHYAKDGQKIMHSTYDLDAIRRAIDKSGLWVQVAEEDVSHKWMDGETDISKELISAVVGLETGGGCAAITSMASAMGKAAKAHGDDNANSADGAPDWVEFGGRYEKKTSNLAQLIFVCENIFGSAHISLVVVSMIQSACSIAYSAGPCIKGTCNKFSLDMHKDTYMWVNPKTIAARSLEILKGMEDHTELRVVDHLKHFIENDADPYNPEATTITDEVQLRMMQFALGNYQSALEKQRKNGVKKGEDKLAESYEGESLEDGVTMINWAVERGAGYDGAWARWYDMQQNQENPPSKFKVNVQDFITKLKKDMADKENARKKIQDLKKQFNDAMGTSAQPDRPNPPQDDDKKDPHDDKKEEEHK